MRISSRQKRGLTMVSNKELRRDIKVRFSTGEWIGFWHHICLPSGPESLSFLGCWLIYGSKWNRRQTLDTSRPLGLMDLNAARGEMKSNFLSKRAVVFSSFNHAVAHNNGCHTLQPLLIWMQGFARFNSTPGADKTNGQSVNIHNEAMNRETKRSF